MYIVLGMIVTVVGIVMVVSPGFFFNMTESWKNSGRAEPSDLYLFSIRLGGVLAFLAGSAGTMILLFFS